MKTGSTFRGQANIFYLNDSAEFHWAGALARKLLRGLIREEADPAREKALRTISSHPKRLRQEMIPDQVFAWSLSEEKDDLSQWRAYCPRGGVAIGFPRKDLEDVAKNQSDFAQQRGEAGIGFAPKLVKCVYAEKDQQELVQSCLNATLALAARARSELSAGPEEVGQGTATFLRLILADEPIKHPKFKGEREWRLMFSHGPGDKCDPEAEPRLGFRSRNGMIIAYWKFRLTEKTKSETSEQYGAKDERKIWRNVRVTVGPSPHPDEQVAAVERLLQYYCADADGKAPGKVTRSSIPYRYW